MKTCTECGKSKPLNQYSKKPDTTDLLQPKCKSCVAAINRDHYVKNKGARLTYQKKYQEENSEARNEYAKAWRKKNKDYIKQFDLIRVYGITQEEKLKMIEDQNGLCAICANILFENRTTHIDHCHDTGKIRAILCHGCNTGIGLFKESIPALQSSISYLEKFNNAKQENS